MAGRAARQSRRRRDLAARVGRVSSASPQMVAVLEAVLTHTMRPLVLHSSALNDAEYAVYTSSLRDLAEDGEPHTEQDFKVGVREARAWLRGRYSTLVPGVIDSILRLFCPSLAPTDILTSGQVFAVLRLVYHALEGKDVDKGLIFVQAHPDDLSSELQHPLRQASLPSISTQPLISELTSDPPSPDANPFFQTHSERAPPITAISVPLSNLPPAVPPKPPTNPFRARRGSEDDHRASAVPERVMPSTVNVRPRAAAPTDSKSPPLPPRKPVIPPAPPPRHSSQHLSYHTISVSTPSTKPHVLVQQSLQAARVAQSLKKAEQRLQQERVLEVLKSSSSNSNNTRRTRSISPIQDGYHSSKTPSVSSSVERAEATRVPVLPPRKKVSPPASTVSAMTARSLESVARASVSFKPPPSVPYSATPAMSEDNRSPTRTPPRSLTDLPTEPPPMHPDRKAYSTGFDMERVPSQPPDSPRVFRSKSMHHPSPPPIPPMRKRRPESVQLSPTTTTATAGSGPGGSPFASPSRPSFPSGAVQPPLSRHHSLSSTLSGRTQRSDGSAVSEPIASLQKTLAGLHQRAQPRFDSARYKAEAALNPRGFVPGTRWMRHEGEERLMEDEDDEYGVGRDDSGSAGPDVDEESEGEREQNDRLRKLRLEDIEDRSTRSLDGGYRRMGVERDDLKWPVGEGEGWKRL
ncbi:uncharacterized protein FIBRA_03132 [Fibroporia radiculosa]|uniref:Uncharacterized protein n=1 Tax=Fibroporia radiculosa TaxID=599839 RepID=J4H285_9APHY|nr:uncharacterized protein FIBRA_03132 [Fibroporia radiculosa]CCM01084.1 predicted protein [Fibroporia radiculosa]